MEIDKMEQLILSLIEFKDELDNSEDERDVNAVIKMISNTINEKQYYK